MLASKGRCLYGTRSRFVRDGHSASLLSSYQINVLPTATQSVRISTCHEGTRCGCLSTRILPPRPSRSMFANETNEAKGNGIGIASIETISSVVVVIGTKECDCVTNDDTGNVATRFSGQPRLGFSRSSTHDVILEVRTYIISIINIPSIDLMILMIYMLYAMKYFIPEFSPFLLLFYLFFLFKFATYIFLNNF